MGKHGYRITREGHGLDELDLDMIDKAMNMRCESFVYTVSRILKEHDVGKEAVAMANFSAKECLDGVWKVAAALSEKHGNEAVSLFLSSFMAAMTLEIVDHTLLSKLLGEAEAALNGEGDGE